MLITLKLNIKVKLNIKKLLYILTQENGKKNVVHWIINVLSYKKYMNIY